MKITDLPTPCLLLDLARMDRNIGLMADLMGTRGIPVRPHLKTCKSLDVAKRLLARNACGVTVSTLAEAEYFSTGGITDIVYAVGIVPGKLDQAAAIMAGGVDLKIMTDDLGTVKAIAAHGAPFRVLIEIDTGDRRGGIQPDSDDLLLIADQLATSQQASLAGVLTHAGHSYGVDRLEGVKEIAELERQGVVRSGERLRAAGHRVDIVSAGSTPTALHLADTSGLTEIRAGVYVFFDLDQQSRGICTREQLAVSVLSTVIGHNQTAEKILLDAGALALSKDLGANKFRPEVAYGEVCHATRQEPYPELYVSSVSQEHGHVNVPDPALFSALPVGAKVRILPNHVCMTAAAHDRYHVIDGNLVTGQWPRIGGWLGRAKRAESPAKESE